MVTRHASFNILKDILSKFFIFTKSGPGILILASIRKNPPTQLETQPNTYTEAEIDGSLEEYSKEKQGYGGSITKGSSASGSMGTSLPLSKEKAMSPVSKGTKNFARSVVKTSREDVRTGDQVAGDRSGR